MSDTNKIHLLDDIIKLVPELSKKRNFIIQKLTKPIEGEPREYVLEQITIKDKQYYRDKYGAVVNDDAILVGVWRLNTNETHQFNCDFVSECAFEYYLFDDIAPLLAEGIPIDKPIKRELPVNFLY